jgi:hypothetical protein
MSYSMTLLESGEKRRTLPDAGFAMNVNASGELKPANGTPGLSLIKNAVSLSVTTSSVFLYIDIPAYSSENESTLSLLPAESSTPFPANSGP